MIKSYKPIDYPEYKNHQIFTTLDKMIDFYKLISFSIFGFITQGTKSMYNIDSYLFSSVQGTLESIKMILKNGRINDAYALVRKYHDSSIINIYSNIYLKDNLNSKNFIVEKINNWVNGKDKLPEYRIMSQYIRKSNKLDQLNKLLYKDDVYKKIRERCNDHAHYNFYYNALLNDNEIYLESRIKVLDRISHDLEQLFVLHVSNIFFLNDAYMMSSDFSDYMDMGMTPPDNCQYFVAPFIQEVFDKFVKKNRPDIANLIKEETEMQLE